MDGMVTVVARVKAKEGMEAAVLKALNSLVAATRQEEGCVDYLLHRGTGDRAQFLFFENWKSADALQRHMETPHFLEWRTLAADLLAEPPEVTLWERTA